jgi:glycosyltransferase involved in cell wall biosynthesis
MGGWMTIVPRQEAPSPNSNLDVSLIIPAKNSSHALENTVQEAHRFLNQEYGNSFEIILVPNPAPGDQEDQSTQVAEKLAQQFSSVYVCHHISPTGKGAAIRTGLTVSRGKWIFFTDADLPYDLEFFKKAAHRLRSGYDLVTGNRRLPSSHFHIPVTLLPLAYGRHRLGLAYNRLVRFLLPIQTTDTQAGIKAMSRQLALAFFEKQTCPGFLFDLELFLTTYGQGFQQTELPVTLHLNSEKSTVRIFRECLSVAYWLSRITGQYFQNHYGKPSKMKKKILQRYRNASFSTRLFLSARWWLTPYSKMASHLPQQGNILDLGCGHGLFALVVALNSPSRQVLGIDHDQSRVNLATQATQDLLNLELKAGSLTDDPPLGSHFYSGIAMIDVMHYFDPEAQEKLIQHAFHRLEKGGTLLIREVDPEGGLASKWNRFYEKLATGIGFTQAEKKGLYFRSRRDWEGLMKKNGFKVSSQRCSSFLFADILYVCERSN